MDGSWHRKVQLPAGYWLNLSALGFQQHLSPVCTQAFIQKFISVVAWIVCVKCGLNQLTNTNLQLQNVWPDVVTKVQSQALMGSNLKLLVFGIHRNMTIHLSSLGLVGGRGNACFFFRNALGRQTSVIIYQGCLLRLKYGP